MGTAIRRSPFVYTVMIPETDATCKHLFIVEVLCYYVTMIYSFERDVVLPSCIFTLEINYFFRIAMRCSFCSANLCGLNAIFSCWSANPLQLTDSLIGITLHMQIKRIIF